MMELIGKGGSMAWIAFLLLMLGGPAWVAGLMLWIRRHNPVQAALEAGTRARQQGDSPQRQYELGRQAALKAARPSSADYLGLMILAWGGILLALGLFNILVAPSPELVMDVLRGRLELAGGQTGSDFASAVSSSLIAGSVAVMMAIPALILAGLGFGYLRTWLLGEPLERALCALVADIDPEGVLPDLQARMADLQAEGRSRWKAAAFITGPFWYLYRGRPGRGLLAFLAWMVLMFAGLGFWLLPAKLFWSGDPLNAGTIAGLFWFGFRDSLVALCVLSVSLYIAIKGDS